MEINEALPLFDALSQETRLRALRHLVTAGPAGLSAGLLSEKLGTPQNTLSFHLAQLANAGLVSTVRQGRSIIYSANFDVVQGLIRFLVRDCCSDEAATLRADKRSGEATIHLGNCCEGPVTALPPAASSNQ